MWRVTSDGLGLVLVSYGWRKDFGAHDGKLETTKEQSLESFARVASVTATTVAHSGRCISRESSRLLLEITDIYLRSGLPSRLGFGFPFSQLTDEHSVSLWFIVFHFSCVAHLFVLV